MMYRPNYHPNVIVEVYTIGVVSGSTLGRSGTILGQPLPEKNGKNEKASFCKTWHSTLVSVLQQWATGRYLFCIFLRSDDFLGPAVGLLISI